MTAVGVGSRTSGDNAAIRPFHVNVPESDLTELRRRISATQWPEREPVMDHSQGVPARDGSGARAPRSPREQRG